MRRLIHLARADGSNLCWTVAKRPLLTGSLVIVTCDRCLRQIEFDKTEEPARIREARYMAERNAAIDAVGFAHIRDHLTSQDDESPVLDMVLGILGSVAVYLHETGYQPPITAHQEAA